jgi:hypothetical protein
MQYRKTVMKQRKQNLTLSKLSGCLKKYQKSMYCEYLKSCSINSSQVKSESFRNNIIHFFKLANVGEMQRGLHIITLTVSVNNIRGLRYCVSISGETK